MKDDFDDQPGPDGQLPLPRKERKPRTSTKVKCRGHKKDGSPCGRWAIAGGAVCPKHGGAAPQVKEAARQRLAALVAPAIAKLDSFVRVKKNDPHVSPQQQLAAARDILDRTGFKPKDEFLVTAEFDVAQFSSMSTEEIRQLVMLARKASSLHDATDADV